MEALLQSYADEDDELSTSQSSSFRVNIAPVVAQKHRVKIYNIVLIAKE